MTQSILHEQFPKSPNQPLDTLLTNEDLLHNFLTKTDLLTDSSNAYTWKSRWDEQLLLVLRQSLKYSSIGSKLQRGKACKKNTKHLVTVKTPNICADARLHHTDYAVRGKILCGPRADQPVGLPIRATGKWISRILLDSLCGYEDYNFIILS